ncbi:MAG: 1-acyl-sn-glycerol-3-phosphate acyltransferase [Candidatus Aminicenantes bacterium]|nr:MAG: 1-acyl-sn-glycerol-3-phosphate acyltransferase [Candidatus Aminicenantes bacterium]
MLSFSYNTLRSLILTIPIIPKPKAIGLENIPRKGPVIYVYNHVTLRGEPVYVGMAAPAEPNIRFFAGTTLTDPEFFKILKRDVESSIFSQKYQRIIKKNRSATFWYTKLIEFLAGYVLAQTNRIRLIGVDLFDPVTEEEKNKRQRTNRKALVECIKSLENNIPLAIAPSGGKTHDGVETPIYNTIVPTLASMLYKKGKVVKIVPSVVKERPLINQKTYWFYAADRIFIYRAVRRLMNMLRIKSYKKPCLTVEFLPHLTFKNGKPSRPEKIEFVQNLQQIIFRALKAE